MILTTIFAGGFGSGKSEISLNYVRKLKKENERIVLADLDLVNPYFASRDQRNLLESEGITVAAPSGSLEFSDVPALPPEIIRILRSDVPLVIDLAGDEAGAVVLGSLRELVKTRGNYEMLLVINPYRPFAETVDNMREMLNILQSAAQIPFTGIVSNPNLIDETTEETVLYGHDMVKEYAREFSLPIKMLCVSDVLAQEIKGKVQEPVMSLTQMLRPDYLKNSLIPVPDCKRA